MPAPTDLVARTELTRTPEHLRASCDVLAANLNAISHRDLLTLTADIEMDVTLNRHLELSRGNLRVAVRDVEWSIRQLVKKTGRQKGFFWLGGGVAGAVLPVVGSIFARASAGTTLYTSLLGLLITLGTTLAYSTVKIQLIKTVQDDVLPVLKRVLTALQDAKERYPDEEA